MILHAVGTVAITAVLLLITLQHVNAHPMDILQFTSEHLERARGFHASGPPQPHWKYFWFD